MIKIVEFPKMSIKMKNFKTFYEAQAASPLKVARVVKIKLFLYGLILF